MASQHMTPGKVHDILTLSQPQCTILALTCMDRFMITENAQAPGRRRTQQHVAAGQQAHRRTAPALMEEDHLPELELYTRAHRLLLAASRKMGALHCTMWSGKDSQSPGT